jgi:23S rRNA pseudouridine1911/1915/1917 synthase
MAYTGPTMNSHDTHIQGHTLTSLILLEADGLIAVNKPAGIPSTGKSLDEPGSMQYALMRHYRRMIWAIHQIDAETTGVNLFTRRRPLVAEVTEALKLHGEKRYLAICHGLVSPSTRRINAPIDWIDSEGRRGITDSGQEAITDVEVLDTGSEMSLLSISLRTGRTHQIRIHLAHMGHPLLGESRYASPPCQAHHRQALHAFELKLPDRPIVRAPLPEDFTELATRCELSLPGSLGL